MTEWKILGVIFDESLSWDSHLNEVVSKCYKTLQTLRKFKRLTSFGLRKNLAEALVLSKIDYCNIVYNNLPEYKMKRLQRIQNIAAGFVNGRFSREPDVINLGWLPIKERIQLSLARLSHKVLYNNSMPKYLSLHKMDIKRVLRSNMDNSTKYKSYECANTFQSDATGVLNDLPPSLRNLETFPEFISRVKSYLFDKAVARVTVKHG